jgi:OmpA family/WD40-like Beta Propeller Repeat
MNTKRLIVLFSALLCLGFTVSLQAAAAKKMKPQELATFLERGNRAYSQSKYAVAAENYESYQQGKDSTDWDVLIKLSDSYWQMRDYKRSGKILTKLVAGGNSGAGGLSVRNRIRVAEMQARLGNYPEAAKWLGGVANYELLAAGYKDAASIESMKEDSMDWTMGYLDINTNFREFSPVIAGKNMIFTSNSPASAKELAFGWDGKSYARLWTIPLKKLSVSPFYSNSDNDSIRKAGKVIIKRLSPLYEGSDNRPMAQKGDVGGKITYIGVDSLPTAKLLGGLQHMKYNVATASLDGFDNLFFSANQPDSVAKRNRLGIMQGKYANDAVTNIQNTVLKDAQFYSAMHPTVNKASTVLVFTSDMAGGKGGFDLYYATRKAVKDPWDAPKAFSDIVNTVGNEVFPYNSADGYLYFSSDARTGLGGLDIYRILMADAMAGVGEVEHIPYPLNSSADDFGWVQDSTEQKGYLTSDRFGTNDNIFRFQYDPKPKLSRITGHVREKKSLQPMPGATVFLYNKTTDKVLVTKADNEGIYKFDVKNFGDFVLKVVESNCKDDGIAMTLAPKKKSKDFIFDAPRDLLPGLTFRNVWVLENLFYDYATANIRRDAQVSLDSLVRILNTYPNMVELGAHTDSRGSVEYNNRLSQRRAESAVAYVVKQGIDPARITAKGYGEMCLKNACADGVNCKEYDHQLNRRTEIMVTYNPAPANSIDPTLYKEGQILSPKSFPVNFFDAR